MPEGQPSKYNFNALVEDSNGGNSTNITEVMFELETRDKPNTDNYEEESRWLVRVSTQTLYQDIVSISSISSTVPIANNAISGTVNGGSNIQIRVDPNFGDDTNGFTCIEDSFIPHQDKIGVVAHNQQWLRSASTYYAQEWNTLAVGGRITPETDCQSESYIKSLTCNLETRKLSKDADSIDEECRYILRLVIGQEGTDITSIPTITNSPSGIKTLGYPFAGSGEIIQLEADASFFGGTGQQGVSENTSGAWTMIRQVIAAIGPIGSKQFTFETHWVSPSLWFPAKWTRTA